MNILAIQGSPRKNGNTDVVLDYVLGALRDKTQAHVEKVYVRDLDIGGCRECFACQKVADKPGCALKDDMIGMYDKILAADMVVFASPVFCWGVTAQIKAVFDRLYATFKFNQNPYLCMLEGKHSALIVTAGGTRDEGATACQQGYEKFCEFAGVIDCGTLLAPSLKQPSDTRTDAKLKQQAEQFAARVAEKL